MSIYKEEIEKLAEICKKCGGKCCIGSDITISKLELKKLKERYGFDQGTLKSEDSEMNVIKNSRDMPCYFIRKVKGKQAELECILKGKMRPLICRLYPLIFLMENAKPKFYLSVCPYRKEISKFKKWINKTVKEAREELKMWTKIEKLCFSSLRKKINKNNKHLIEIENE